MGTNNDTITNCPAHLEPALATARARWARHRTADCRQEQAAEVLQFASDCMSRRSWDTSGADDHAALGAWLARTALIEDKARIAALAATPKAADLGTLTADEIALILAARKGAK